MKQTDRQTKPSIFFFPCLMISGLLVCVDIPLWFPQSGDEVRPIFETGIGWALNTTIISSQCCWQLDRLSIMPSLFSEGEVPALSASLLGPAGLQVVIKSCLIILISKCPSVPFWPVGLVADTVFFLMIFVSSSFPISITYKIRVNGQYNQLITHTASGTVPFQPQDGKQ